MTAERIQALDGIGFEGETNVFIYIYIYIHIHVYIYIIIKSFVDYLAIKRI